MSGSPSQDHDNLLAALTEVESRVVEGGYTLGAFNRRAHAHVIANALGDEAIESAETDHLKFERGKGVVKIQEADCLLCETDGLNDGRWHDPKTLTMPESSVGDK